MPGNGSGSGAFFLCIQLQTDPNRFIDFAHQSAVYMADELPKTLLVDGPNLFQQDDRIFYDMIFLRTDPNVRRQLRLVHP